MPTFDGSNYGSSDDVSGSHSNFDNKSNTTSTDRTGGGDDRRLPPVQLHGIVDRTQYDKRMIGTCLASKVIDVRSDTRTVHYAISGALWGCGSDGAIIVADILRVELGDESSPAGLYLPKNGWHFPVVNRRRCTPIGRAWVTVPRKGPSDGYVMLGMEGVGDVAVELKRAEHCLLVVVHCVGGYNNSQVMLNVSGTVYGRPN